MPRRQTTDLESSRCASAGSTATSIASQRASTASAPAAIALAPTERNRIQAAVYARVSTDKQEREETIKSQIAALREAAEHRGYALSEADEFRDEGYSGARLDRPGLDRLRDLVADGAYDVVLVLAPDRLARQYAYQVVVIEELAQAGCRVEFLSHAGGTSPEEQMLLQIQGVFAESPRMSGR